MRLKEIEKEAKKEEILNRARKLFSEKGFENTSMEEIANKVKIAKGTIYLYFDSKDSLFLEVIEFARKKMLENLKGLFKSKDSVIKKIKKIIQLKLDFSKQYPEYHKIFHMLLYQSTPEIQKKILKIVHSSKNKNDPYYIISEMIQDGIKKGELKPHLNVYNESFRIWSLTLNLTIISNLILHTPLKEFWELKGQFKGEEIIWDTIDQILTNWEVK